MRVIRFDPILLTNVFPHKLTFFDPKQILVTQTANTIIRQTQYLSQIRNLEYQKRPCNAGNNKLSNM